MEGIVTKRLAIIITAGFFLLGIRTLCAADMKIGIVDIQKVFSSSVKAKQNEDIYKKEVAAEMEKMTQKQNEFKKLKEELEKQKSILSPDQQKKKEAELNNKGQEFSDLLNEGKKKLDRRRDELENASIQEILKTAREYGKSKGYTMILSGGAVLYSIDALDITNEIIGIINQ